ncbi:Cytochrome oxidase assembly [Marasmius sp. AFHP31]|nr:Cytochrome oxidase assembly [Marasmius sp. AFHP31]
MVFESKPLNPTKLNRTIQQKPWLFGIPFVLLMVAASYGMTTFTQTRYDLHDQKVKKARIQLQISLNVTKEQELGLDKNRRKFDIREEYFKLSAETDNNWEIKRIQRPKGLPEWGVPPTEPPPKSPEDSKS